MSRVWRTYRVQPGERAAAGPRRTWSLPHHPEEVAGLYVAPPVCVLAVTTRPRRGGPARTSPAVATARLFGR
ncbi:hypothetical protein NGM37_43165, partial [Streptomyces sp. TRM76130]|nr:hypothetical protein [Streptomyces sp. TRM76130]